MNILSMLAAENMFHFGSIHPSPTLFGSFSLLVLLKISVRDQGIRLQW